MYSYIYKYYLSPGETEIEADFAEILKVAFQGDDLCLWAQISPEVPRQRLKIYVLPTGMGFKRTGDMYYLDTVQDNGYVWHIFYKIEKL